MTDDPFKAWRALKIWAAYEEEKLRQQLEPKMKIDIDYYIPPTGVDRCGAQIRYQDQIVCRSGQTWEEAKQKVVEAVQEWIRRESLIPKRESVDISIPVETEELAL